ncbi:peptidoglycan transglycosylase [Xanthomonas phage SB3]|uniref:Peptidoglycan transglycosylase n=1 Tax=Xanthomonas phage SB3 TaxID=3117472 RepID=A0ABZ2GVJ8_9CAUD
MALDFNGKTQDEIFAAASAYAGVPEAVMRGQWSVESSQGTQLTSPAGARGHFHSMPKTTATWEQRSGKKFNVDDFASAAELYAMTMQENMQLAGGDMERALRIYHGGTDEKNWGPINAAYAGKVIKAGGLDGGESLGQSGRSFAVGAKSLKSQTDPATFDAAWRGDPISGLHSIKGSKAVKEYLSDYEKGTIDNARQVGATAALIEGENVLAAAEEFGTLAKANLDSAVQARTAVNVPNAPQAESADRSDKDFQAGVQAAIERENFAQAQTFNDKWGAHFGNTLTAGAMRAMLNPVDKSYPEGWRYIDTADETENGHTMEERMMLREATSPEDIQRIKSKIEQLRHDRKIMGTLGSGANFFYGTVASVSDPLGWAAGVGVGKAASLLGVGARTYIAAGRPLAALGSAAAEGAVGNLLTSVTLDALGDYRTPYDHMEDMAMGLVFGAALGLPGARSARINALSNQIIGQATSQKVAMAVKAQNAAGPGATPTQVKAAMQTVIKDEETAWRQSILGDVPESDRFFSRPDVQPERAPAGTTGPGVTSVFRNKKARKVVEDKYGLGDKITDNATRLQVAEAVGRAEGWLARNPIDLEKADTKLRIADMESTSTTLIFDESPLSKAFAAKFLENPEGAAGRHATGAILKSQLQETYLGTARRELDTQYNLWASEQGHGFLSRNVFTDGRKRFMREVALEIDRRLNNGTAPNGVHPTITSAADAVHGVYKRAGSDMKHAGVVGSDNIDVNMPYFQRRFDLNQIRAMQNDLTKRNAFLSMLEDQFENVAGYGDDQFIKGLARTYLERLEHRASGLVDTPAAVYNDGTADILRDSLRALRLNEEEINAAMKRFQRGAPGMTKSRIEMDLNRSYPDGQGGSFKMVDFIDTDLQKLMRDYTGRASGEVALARHGIMGEAGLKTYELGIRMTGGSNEAIRAFQQVSAELLGRPFGKGDNKLLQNVRMLTGAARLGSAVFPQLGAYLDAGMGIGAARAMRALTDAPRLHKEIRKMAKGEKVEGGILSSLEDTGVGQFGMRDYNMFGLFDSPEMTEVFGKESLGPVSQAIRGSANASRILSGHRALTAVQNRGFAEQIVHKAIGYIKQGGAEYDKALLDMGFDKAHVDTMRRILPDIATFDKAGKLTELDVRKIAVDDMEARHAINNFRTGVTRGTSQILNQEFTGEVGKWAHNGYLKMLFQFRTFSLVAHQKALGRGMAVHGNKALLGYVVGAMSIAAPVHIARSALRASMLPEEQREKYLSEQMHPLTLGRATMNYIAALGLLPDVLEMGGGFGGGMADMVGMERPSWLKPTGGRTGAQSDFLGGTIAPGLGLVNDVAQGLHGRPSQMVRSLPGNSLWYLQPLWLGGEAQMKEFTED